MNYCLLMLWTKFEEQAFLYSGLAAWNTLPHHICASPSLDVLEIENMLFEEAVSCCDSVMHWQWQPTLL